MFSLANDPETIGDFIVESREHLAQVEVQMMTLEKDPGAREAIDTVFRAFHTIKGLAGFLELAEVGAAAHETETLLGRAREGELAVTSTVVDAVLAAADFLEVWLDRLAAQLAGAVPGPPPDPEAVVQGLRLAATGEAAGATAAAPEPQTVSRSSAVKVDTGKLDSLVDMAGELAIAEAMVRHHPELAGLRSPALLRSLAQLARITGDLQQTAMSMRMVPVGGLFQKMNRLARDLARKTGKAVEVECGGADAELDRHVVEELAGPLMHMVRNAVDHGLESPEERRAAGKPSPGLLRLRASHRSGQIVIEVSDDGRGLDREKILAKARRTGLLAEPDGPALTDREVFAFIFHPGFSTAAHVTELSGRGVGMDVVKSQIQQLRGRIDIESQPGQGTAFFLRLPLTLATIDGLVVGVGDERYVLPVFAVREVLRPTEAMLSASDGLREMAMVRQTPLPVVRLGLRLGVKPRSDRILDGLLVVAEAGEQAFCLLVDRVIGKQEVVIKSLGESLRGTPGVSGGAILGDGRVSLILDLERIWRPEAR